MRKKSHLKITQNIINENNIYNTNRKYLYIGSILPDCIPSFITKRHNITQTSEIVKKIIKDLETININTRRFWIKIGCLLHYISDYFTYPHTVKFDHNFFIHNSYENMLRLKLRDKLNNLKINNKINIKNIDIWTYLENQQKEYLNKISNDKNKFKLNLEFDCEYIIKVCKYVFEYILSKKECMLSKKEYIYA